jgi:hypothetical protein
MSFEISELMVQLAEASEKKEPACREGTTKAPAPPPVCVPGTTKAPQPPQKPKPDIICSTGTTKAQQTSTIDAVEDLDAVRAQLRERLVATV